MKNKTLSTLGFFMQYLNIPTGSMSQALHVDASLVSKWKTGKRAFSDKTIYFDQVLDYLLAQGAPSHHQLLKDALLELYPHETMEQVADMEQLLRQALSSTPLRETASQHKLSSPHAHTVPTLVFEGNAGRREAMEQMMDYARHMTVPGELIFLDSEEYAWILEDKAFSARFLEQVIDLLHKGFHAKFVIHYSALGGRFAEFFHTCSALIFHRNVEWYYYEYYDEKIIHLSFFILNHAVSLLGISAEGQPPSTMVFTDSACVIQHEGLANHVIEQCSSVFQSFHPMDFRELVNDIPHFQRRGAFYTFLPVPAFLSSPESLLRDILTQNGIRPDEIEQQLLVSDRFRQVTACDYSKKGRQQEPFVLIFQLEPMLRRIQEDVFVSGSLTILNGKQICVTKRQIAQEIRHVAQELMQYPHMHIVLASEKDNIRLPSINCWCKQNQWIVQMNREGFRLSDEISIVNAAASALENCVRRVPPARKEKQAVYRFLLDLAEELDRL